MMWDSGAAGDYSALNSEDVDSEEDILGRDETEDNELCTDPQELPEKESNIYKSFHFLEKCSFIDFLDTNGEFIISAGRDHDIKVWDAAQEKIIRRFVGHTAPITGIKLQSTDPSEASSADLTVISSSEDGSIREWSLRKGIEIRKIETENVITCMGIMTNKLAAIGNHKGHLDVYHLPTGQLYCSIVAHNDPIDALMVNDMHICTAVYDRPGSLRVWQLKWGKVICMYSLEDIFLIEFASFTIYGDLIILGDGTEQKLHILSYMTEDTTDTLQLSEKAGHVQQVAVTDGLVLASTVDNNKMVHLHVYQLHDFDCLGTFYCKNMDRVSSITLIKNHELKFLLGGSALAVLKLEFSSRKDVNNIDSSSKSLKQPEDVNSKSNEKIKETTDGKDLQNTENCLIEENHKSQNIKSNTTTHCHEKQLSFESFTQLPPIVKSKTHSNTDQKCKHPESEHLNNSNKQGIMLPELLLKANFQQITNNDSTTPPTKEFNRLELDSSKDQGNIQQLSEPVQEKQRKDDLIEHPLFSHEKKIIGDTTESNGTNVSLPKRIPQTITQKQKYESEKVRIIKVHKQQEEGKKHNWLHLSKKKQKSTEKVKQKKNKEKDCMIM